MQSVKDFIEEVMSLEVRNVELLSERFTLKVAEDENGEPIMCNYTAVQPLFYFDINECPKDDLTIILGNNNIKKGTYWDLSHYGEKNEISFGKKYEIKLYKLVDLAFEDIALLSKEQLEIQIIKINQYLEKAKRFFKTYDKENMIEYQFNNNECFHLNTRYYQEDLELKYLSCFNYTGIEQKYNGYSSDFIGQMYNIAMAKKGSLEMLKTRITALINGVLKRKKIFEEGYDEYIFDNDEKEWVLKTDSIDNTDCKHWKTLIIPTIQFDKNIENIEAKIQDKISNWKQRIDLIECAAFCQLLFDKKYFVKGSTIRKSVNEFSVSKYGVDITVQLKSTNNKARETHKSFLKSHFN